MTVHLIPAASAALRRGDRFLLVERGRPPSQGLFAFPGGRLEPGESAEAAARRELTEETGLRAGRLALWRVLDLGGGGGPLFRLSVFTGELLAGEPVAQDDAASAGWYDLDQMLRLPMTGSTLSAVREMLGLAEAPAP